MYVQGVSSTLPLEVQKQMYKSILGLENVKIMRPAYGIEYDCIDPTILRATLEHKDIKIFSLQVKSTEAPVMKKLQVKVL